jgi:methionyl-tRNA formyltransferase
MRILFAGSPHLALPSLEAVHAGHELAAVLTNPDRPAGRGGAAAPTPVKERALQLGLPVLQPRLLDLDFTRQVEELGCELLVVAAFGRIFPPEFLAVFPRGGVNVHPSLLPRHRGPSPIPAAILAGDPETGVSVQRLAARMDSGDILRARSLPLAGRETTASLTPVLAALGAELLAEVLAELAQGRVAGRHQEESAASYCRLVRKEDGRIAWDLEPELIERRIRAYDPWPGAFTTFRGQTLHLLEAGAYPGPLPRQAGSRAGLRGLVFGTDNRYGILVRAGQGVLSVTRLQLQAKKPMDWRSFLNGRKDFVGSQLGVDG